jgi:N-acyl-D-aspartate/D-glutamate deacylase
MSFVLRNGLLIDGTGGPGLAADVQVTGSRISAVDKPGTLSGDQVIDVDGLVVAPGFIDVHTHYDAQVFWDRDLSPSCWHGVTTVVMGNCGFGIAPTRPEHRETIARTLENVEGMSFEALTAGIPWTFESFPDYLLALKAEPTRLNVGAFIGHTPLRLYVMGDDVERPASAAEVAQMRAVVGEALEAGAMGFATSGSPSHQGAYGRPVPSRFADVREEIFALAEVLGEKGRGVVQATTGPELFLEELAEISLKSGRPVTWTALLTGMTGRHSPFDLLDRGSGLGGEVWPQIACRPIVMQLSLEDPFPFGVVPAGKEVLAVPRNERAALYANAEWRNRARAQLADTWAARWPRTTVQETSVHTELVGRDVLDIATERGRDPFDTLVELSLAEDLKTRFRIVLFNDDEETIGRLLQDDRTLLALSDAGAHASQLCDACFSTDLLGHWVRELGVLDLEQAVWRLTGHPASVFRISDRGHIAPGYWADIVAFDLDKVGASQLERVWDLPGGSDRLIAQSTGIEHVWVNGQAIRTAGRDVDGARPGLVLGAAGG